MIAMSATRQSTGIRTEELIGPLNEFERKYAPETLFLAGNPQILTMGPRVAIVGSRRASPAGLARARKLSVLLVGRGVTVVSGLAEGIDTAAHTACIDRGGRTIAVIGTSLEGRYPKENAILQEKIMREHLCISQFAPGSETKRQNFPLRNRTMALLSDVTVIVEAADKSGSLHQGWEALRLNRGLFIANSVVSDASLKWPTEMREYGASILSDENIDELFERLPERSTITELAHVPF